MESRARVLCDVNSGLRHGAALSPDVGCLKTPDKTWDREAASLIGPQ